MPLFYRGRLRKRWRYVAVWSPQISLSVCRIEIGPFYQEFWALWDGQTLLQRTRLLPGMLDLSRMRVRISDKRATVELMCHEVDAFQVMTFDDRAYTWTAKQLVRVTGSIRSGGVVYEIDAPGLVDESAGYHPRHTHYKWSAGAGKDVAGRSVAWNLVTGINDHQSNSERTVWLDGVPQETGPVRIDNALTSVAFAESGGLNFKSEAVRHTRKNLLAIRSNYRHPFGEYSGTLPGNIQLLEGHGVMENHEVFW